MLAYAARRILLMIPTIFGILLISFAIVQFAPGGPVERVIAQLQGLDKGATARFGGGGGDIGAAAAQSNNSRYRGAQGLDPKFIADLRSSSASTNRRPNASCSCCAIMRPSISARAISATCR